MIEKIKIGGKDYPIAYNMLSISRIKKGLGATDFKQLADKVTGLQGMEAGDTMDALSEILEPMGLIAHHGLYAGGVLAEKPYTKDLNETMMLLSNFDEVIQCFVLFSNQFAAFFTSEQPEAGKKKATKINP